MHKHKHKHKHGRKHGRKHGKDKAGRITLSVLQHAYDLAHDGMQIEPMPTLTTPEHTPARTHAAHRRVYLHAIARL